MTAVPPGGPPVPCAYCGRGTVPWAKPGGTPPLAARTAQHVLPRRRGGTSAAENIKVACRECNHLLGIVDDCPGALAALRAVARGRAKHRRPCVTLVRATILASIPKSVRCASP